MTKYCENCRKKLDEKADICPNCGISLINISKSYNNTQSKGLSIAGMILGIISLTIAIIIFVI